MEEKITKKNFSIGLNVIKRYLKRYKHETIILSTLGIVSAIGNGIVPLVAGRFFDAIVKPGSFTFLNTTLPLFAALLILWSIVQVITYLMDWQINIKSENFSNKVWVDYWSYGIGHILMLPISFHKEQKIGEVGEKVNRAAFSLETIIGRIVIDLAPQILSIVIAVGVSFFLKPILAVILLVGLILYIFILKQSVAPLAAIQKEYQTHLFRAFGDSYDLLGNTQTVKQSTAEHFERERITGLLKGPVLGLWNKLNRVWSNLTLAQKVIILGTQLTIFIVSVAYIQNGGMTIGDLLAFNAYATMIFGPFVVIGRNWQVIQNGIIQLEEAEQIIGEAPEAYHPSGAFKETTLHGNLRFDNVSFYYEKEKPVLQNISFEVKEGQVIALVGESGVGKSTLIDLISGYHFPKEGKLLVDGQPIQSVDLISLRRQIGVVPQEVVLFNDTIKHNIRYGSFKAGDDEVETAAKKAHAYDFIQKFPNKWEQLVGERGVKLSVGQKQRVAIARAILRNPKILILDEPTSALDAGSEKIITESLEELMRGKTTFIIAHRLSTVRKADNILVFKEGKIIETGKHDELLKIEGGEYRRLYELQIGLHQ
ncbi:MAG: hypothetical protein A3A22_00820 [Candidatus Taylorbacteria bacterium RIFCSPLOWO2_01_FULL_45_34b]|nr:MAG: hypothetical protein A3A22_00820 [Candidatus Taylorbacteria bacterium RIFCSPLOWO2_01_FULL_45_34b]